MRQKRRKRGGSKGVRGVGVEVQGGKVVRVWSWGVGQGGEEVGMTIALLVDQRGLQEERAEEGMSFVLGEEGG